MKVSGIIYTTNKTRWVKTRLSNIYDTILRAKGVEVEAFQIKEIVLPQNVPTKLNGGGIRIDWDWLQANYPTDGSVLCLHITKEERDQLGLKHPTPGKELGGSYNKNIGDISMEFVVIADTYSEFERIFLHELSHGMSHWSGVKDETHHYDYDLHDIDSIYDTLNFSRWDIMKLLTVLLPKLIYNLTNSVGPRFKDNWPISQEYGEISSHYPKTGRHIGVDWACPIGTEILAPINGEILESGLNDSLGYYCYFQYEFKGVTYVERINHQSVKPLGNRTIKKGEVIGLSGNTGDSTGPHCHIDTWVGGISLSNINEENWDILTVDPRHLDTV